MGFDPVTIGLIASAVTTGVTMANKPKAPTPKTPGAPPAAVDGGLEHTGKKRRQYRPAAQLFDDKDLRLGAAGKLGM